MLCYFPQFGYRILLYFSFFSFNNADIFFLKLSYVTCNFVRIASLSTLIKLTGSQPGSVAPKGQRINLTGTFFVIFLVFCLNLTFVKYWII